MGTIHTLLFATLVDVDASDIDSVKHKNKAKQTILIILIHLYVCNLTMTTVCPKQFIFKKILSECSTP